MADCRKCIHYQESCEVDFHYNSNEECDSFFDLADHDKQIRNEVIEEIIQKINQLKSRLLNNSFQTIFEILEYLEQMKGEQNE